MKSRGFDVSPVTVGLCEKDPSICFGPKSWLKFNDKDLSYIDFKV